MRCAGSAELEANFPDTTSPHAEEGTAAHALAEGMLKGEIVDPKPGDTVETEENVFYVINAEMIRHVTDFVALVHTLKGETGRYLVEQRVGLNKIGHPDIFGTSDVILWHNEEKILDVVDLKYGAGKYVAAVDNEQLIIYILGTVLKIDKKPNLIRGHIFQPRNTGMDDEAHRVWELTWDELIEWKNRIVQAAEKASSENPPLTPGEIQCRWCKAKATCPALVEQSLEIARLEFAPVVTETTYSPPAVEGLTEDEVNVILSHADQIEGWLKSIREHAKNRLLAGEEVKGWKLVQGRASRKWADEDAAERFLRKHLGAKGAYKKEVLSVAQAEKALKGAGKPALQGGLIATSHGVSLVPESNPKPAITAKSAVDEFTTEEK